MSIDHLDVVDIISIDPAGDVVLTISDHLDWSDTIHHQTQLQSKFNTYLSFVESGEILQKYPNAKDKPVVFKVVFKFKPDQAGVSFLEKAKQTIEFAGFHLKHEIFAESYDN